jgi:ketosteroid isomerase-like protein
MRKTCMAVLIALAAAQCCVSAAYGQSSTPKSAVEAQVLATVAERDKAFVGSDENAVARFMADDYLQTDAVGHVQDKPTWFKEYFEPIAAKINSRESRWEVFRKTDLQVRDLGNVAVVIGALELKLKGWRPSGGSNDRPLRRMRITQVWVKRDGTWKMAVVHNMYSPEKGKNQY